MEDADGTSLSTFLHRLQWGLVALAAGWLLWLLAPVLTPFVVAGLLGWLGDPLVDRMQRRGVPRPLRGVAQDARTMRAQETTRCP